MNIKLPSRTLISTLLISGQSMAEKQKTPLIFYRTASGVEPVREMKKQNFGSSLDDFLKEEGIFEELLQLQ